MDKTQDKTEKFWDKVAKSEAQRLDKFDDDYLQTLKAVDSYLTQDARVLDFASGSGKVALAIADKVAHLTGIDISSGMVEVAQTRAKQQGISNTDFIHGTVDSPQLQPQSYDIIIAYNILHLLDDPQDAVSKLAKLIKPGGLFIASTGVLGEKRSLLAGLLWFLSKINILPKMHFYKSAQLKRMIGNEFELLDANEFDGTFRDLLLVGRR